MFYLSQSEKKGWCVRPSTGLSHYHRVQPSRLKVQPFWCRQSLRRETSEPHENIPTNVDRLVKVCPWRWGQEISTLNIFNPEPHSTPHFNPFLAKPTRLNWSLEIRFGPLIEIVLVCSKYRLMYAQVGDFCVCRGPPTVPLTQILHNTVPKSA